MSDQGHAAAALLEQIANLVAKSLVTLDESAPSGRWGLLETIRAYALELLSESGDADRSRELLQNSFETSSRQPCTVPWHFPEGASGASSCDS
jgi:predicted ATPase